MVARGPGEKSTCELLHALQQGKTFGDIEGLVFRENGSLVETHLPSADKASLFPPLDFSLIDVERYIKSHDQGSGKFSYLTSRGCFGRCAFCSSRLIDKQKRFRKPAEQCIEELKQVVARHGVGDLVISDPVAFANHHQAADLVDIIRQAGDGTKLSWRCDARIDVLSRLPEETYRDLADSGCRGFAIGIESGDNRMLQLMQKDITEAQIETVLAAMSRHGFHDNLFWFIAGFPGETPRQATRTLQLACRIRTLFPRSSIVLAWYKPQLAGQIPAAPAAPTRPRIGKTSVGVASYYLSASAQRAGRSGGLKSRLKRAYQRVILARVKHQIFLLPVEYLLYRLREFLRTRLTHSGPRH